MTFWIYNPPEPHAETTDALHIGDNGTVLPGHARRCGNCSAVPPMWKLQLGAGYPRGSSPLYLYRRPWRHPTIAAEGDPPIYVTVPGQCRWLTEPQGAAGFRYFFELIFDSEDVEEFAGEWNLLDWNESAYPSGEPVRYSRLWDPETLDEVATPEFAARAKFRCLGSNLFRYFTDPESDPPILSTITPWYGTP